MTTGGVARPAGFWRRVAAALVDSLVLGLVGWLLGWFCRDLLVQLGPWGRLLGFGIAAAYFVPFNSRLGGGRTPGKQLLGIRVVDGEGRSIGLARSLLRYAALAPPIFLNNIQLPGLAPDSPWLMPLSLLVFGLGTSALYLLVFNRRTRQLPHDLLAGSYVVRVAAEVPHAPLWPGHVLACGTILALAAALPVLMQRMVGPELAARFMGVQKAAQAQAGVIHAAVSESSQEGSEEAPAVGLYKIVATVQPGHEQGNNTLHQVVDAALRADPKISQADQLQVTLQSGYDIGIQSGWSSQSLALTPLQWRYRIDMAAVAASKPPAAPLEQLQGRWSWTTPNGCVETHDYAVDGSLVVVSGSEHTQSRYRIEEKGGTGPYLPLRFETLSDDGGKDCAESSEDDSGRVIDLYMAFHPDRDALAFCSEPKPGSCWGVYRRVRVP